MKTTLFLFSLLVVASLSGQQINLINTGTTAKLYPIQKKGNTVVINGNGASPYLVKSTDGCESLVPLTLPVGPGYFNTICLADSSNLYLLSTLGLGIQSLVHKSTDGGQTWIKKLDTAGWMLAGLKFFDANEGISTEYDLIFRTKDGGNTWSKNSVSSYFTTALEVYDSLVCLGVGNGLMRFSKNRGYNWSPFTNMSNGSPMDFFFLNKDTIFGVSTPGLFGEAFTKTTNGGLSWQVSTLPSWVYSGHAVHFKSAKEGYVIGVDRSDSMGLILKTTDLGKTWSKFKTPFQAKLLDFVFLNDSIALISGDKGILFTWNCKQTIFTGVNDHSAQNLSVKIFPNPVKDKLFLEYDNARLKISTLKLVNALGEIVYSENEPGSKKEIDLSFLPPGVYYLKIENKTGQKVFKVIKE